MLDFSQKNRLSKGGIYPLTIVEASKEISDKGTSIKITFAKENEDIEHSFFFPIVDDSATEGKIKVFKAQANEIVQALCTIEDRKKKNPLQVNSYDELADNITTLFNKNKGLACMLKVVVNTYNGKSKLTFPAFGNWLSTSINGNKPLIKDQKDIFDIPEPVEPSDDLSSLMGDSTSESSNIAKADAPF